MVVEAVALEEELDWREPRARLMAWTILQRLSQKKFFPDTIINHWMKFCVESFENDPDFILEVDSNSSNSWAERIERGDLFPLRKLHIPSSFSELDSAEPELVLDHLECLVGAVRSLCRSGNHEEYIEKAVAEFDKTIREKGINLKQLMV